MSKVGQLPKLNDAYPKLFLRNLLPAFHVSPFYASPSSKLVMLWPKLWSSSTKDEHSLDVTTEQRVAQAAKEDRGSPRSISVVGTDWANSSDENPARNVFTEARTILAAVTLTSAILASRRFYKAYIKRVPEATKIKEAWLGKRSMFGTVTSVGDGDNFRLFHTPGGRLAGWGWFPGRRVPTEKSELKNNTVRLISAC